MTLIIQVIVLIALLLTGTILAFGLFQGSGTLLTLGTYFGWFAATASLASYLVLLILFSIRGVMPSWGRICLMNVGLSLIGISIFGIDFSANQNRLLVTAPLALILALVLGRLRFFDSRLSIFAILAVIVAIVLTPAIQGWALAFFGIGIVIAASQLVALLRLRSISE